MEDFNINSTSLDESYNYRNITYNHSNYRKIILIMNVSTCIIICIGLPLTLLAIYALYSLVRNDQVAPIYVINLLISDFIQLCCMIVEVVQPSNWLAFISQLLYLYGLMASVGFMVCVALERYLVVACPLWYRFRRTIKISVVVCVVVWAFPLVYALTTFLFVYFIRYASPYTSCAVFLLLPFPLFIFFLAGTLKALSASHIHSDEKRRIVGCLVLVLLIYTLLYLPCIILLLTDGVTYDDTLPHLSLMFLKLSPLADLVLYVFMRKGTISKLLASVCCSRMNNNEISSSTV